MVDVVKGKATEKYDVGEIIGRGKFSTVKLCTEKDSGKEFAVKILRTARRGCSRDAILNEVRIMNMCVDCMYILKLVEVFDGGREFHLVEELAECGDLYSRCLAEENHAEENEVRNYIRQLLSALVFIHGRNIVHCDIKPENVLVTRADTDNIRLVDFGLARIVSPKDKVCEIIGTTEYVAPEILSFEPITAACDMWSLGVLAYTLLSGISPFLGDNDSETYANISHCDYDFYDEVFDNVSDEAQHFISELLEVKPRIRPGAHEMSTHNWMVLPISSPSITSSESFSNVRATSSAASVKSDTSSTASQKPASRVNSNQNVKIGSYASNTAMSPTTTTTMVTPAAPLPGPSTNTTSSISTSTHGESTRNEIVGVDQSSRTGSTLRVFQQSQVHSAVERAYSLPTDERSRKRSSFQSQEDCLTVLSGEEGSPHEMSELREGSLTDSPALIRHRRSQSCKSFPSSVLIERQDPEASFSYLQEQAIRLVDKIEAMFVDKIQQRRRLSGYCDGQPMGEHSSSAIGQLLSGEGEQTRHGQPIHSTPVRSHSMSATAESMAGVAGSSASGSPGGVGTQSSSPRSETVPNSRRSSSEAAQLLHKVRIHLKSSASISGLRQLERPRGLHSCDSELFERNTSSPGHDFSMVSSSAHALCSREASVDRFRHRHTRDSLFQEVEGESQRPLTNQEYTITSRESNSSLPGVTGGGVLSDGYCNPALFPQIGSYVATDQHSAPSVAASFLAHSPPGNGTEISGGGAGITSASELSATVSRSTLHNRSMDVIDESPTCSASTTVLHARDLSSPDLIACYTVDLDGMIKSVVKGSTDGARSGDEKYQKAAALRQYWSGTLNSFPGVSPIASALSGLMVGAACAMPDLKLGVDCRMGRKSSAYNVGSCITSRTRRTSRTMTSEMTPLERLDTMLAGVYSRYIQRKVARGLTASSAAAPAEGLPRVTSHPVLPRGSRPSTSSSDNKGGYANAAALAETDSDHVFTDGAPFSEQS